MIHRFYSVVLAVFLIFFAWMPGAEAFVGKEKIPPLKDNIQMPADVFENGTKLIEKTPLDNKDLAFRVRLPKSWQEIPVESTTTEGGDLFRQVAAFTSPPRIERRSVFRVRTVELNALIQPDDWFIGYMIQMGFSVEGMTIENPRRVLVQYTLFEDGEPFVTRAVVSLSGSRIILAEYMIHQDVFEKEHQTQMMAMNSFQMMSPSSESPVVMKTFTFADIAKFDYPDNWYVASPGITDISRMDASITNAVTVNTMQNGNIYEDLQLAGRVDISVVSKSPKTSLADEVKRLNDDLAQKKFKLGKYVETVKNLKLNPLISQSRVDVYQMEGTEKKLAGYEFWVAVLQTSQRYYLVRLTTIDRSEDFVLWAQNTEVFKTFLASIGPAGESAQRLKPPAQQQ